MRMFYHHTGRLKAADFGNRSNLELDPAVRLDRNRRLVTVVVFDSKNYIKAVNIKNTNLQFD